MLPLLICTGLASGVTNSAGRPSSRDSWLLCWNRTVGRLLEACLLGACECAPIERLRILLIFLVSADVAAGVFELLDEPLSEVCGDNVCGSSDQVAVSSVSLSPSSVDDLNLLRFGVELLVSVHCSLVNGGTKMAAACVVDGSNSSSGWLAVIARCSLSGLLHTKSLKVEFIGSVNR